MRTEPETTPEQDLADVLQMMRAESAWQFTTERGLAPWPRATRKWAGHYRNPADFVLAHGEFFTPRATPAKYGGMKPAACFANNLILVSAFPELTYVEGIVWAPPALRADTGMPVGRPRPVHHAWAVDPDGLLVEVTYRSTARAILNVRNTHAYLGVRFVDGHLVKRHVWDNDQTVLDDPRSRYRLLRRPFDASAQVARRPLWPAEMQAAIDRAKEQAA